MASFGVAECEIQTGSSYNLKNLRVPTTISGSIIESLDSYIASGLKSRSQDLEKRNLDLQNDFRRTSGLLRNSRILMQPPGYKINLQTPIVHISLDPIIQPTKREGS
ncbi:hypothetical protein DY000_02014409 [Brassica cretica]|uniref:Uncharacterized protein n=1 Tax=Brassica cretica TaxID=69181 RepID=A0ABQ7CT42_BRACR|nr:hypothetical protein DY000_02014409 [Brassica cretica]